ncbi:MULTISPECIES: carboxymuconolactone decarboxylase family protein [unclassified Saccharothrix]|uniref:carboxymuconolactone decarboxylase family protein n=1 Tax=unclassified Saccharothrix TaxID=2593673 RepID=UPI00307DBA1E
MSSTSRLSNPQDLVPALKDVSKALFAATGTGPLPRTTIGLIQLRAGQIVGNTYLTVLHTTTLRRAGDTEERITGVATWRDAPYYTPAERAALALVEAVLQPAAQGERVPDALYGEVAEHYDEAGIAALAVAIGQVNFFVPLALIGKPAPGVSPAEQWTKSA